jgi:hypothetical protein
MRAALLLSVMFVIGGLASLFGVPAIYVAAKPVFGVAGFATSLVFAAIPPLLVLGWRKYSRKATAALPQTDVPSNKSLERAREE